MLVGEYSREGRPLLWARLVLPDFAISDQVGFLLDTGSDLSLLSPSDCGRLGLAERLRESSAQAVPSPRPVRGIGGPIRPLLLRAQLSVATPRGTLYHDFRGLNVLPPAMVDSYAGFDHSLLGWDFLEGFRVVLERRASRVALLLPEEPWPAS